MAGEVQGQGCAECLWSRQGAGLEPPSCATALRYPLARAALSAPAPSGPRGHWERGVPGSLRPAARQLLGNRLRLTPSAAPDSASPAFPSPRRRAITAWPRGAGARRGGELLPAGLASSEARRRSRAEGSRWLARGRERGVLHQEAFWIRSGCAFWKEGAEEGLWLEHRIVRSLLTTRKKESKNMC